MNVGKSILLRVSPGPLPILKKSKLTSKTPNSFSYMKTKSENLIDPNLLAFIFPSTGDAEGATEGHFGKWPCECCGDNKAGGRYAVMATYRDQYGEKGRIEKWDSPDRCFSVCPDCVSTFQ